MLSLRATDSMNLMRSGRLLLAVFTMTAIAACGVTQTRPDAVSSVAAPAALELPEAPPVQPQKIESEKQKKKKK